MLNQRAAADEFGIDRCICIELFLFGHGPGKGLGSILLRITRHVAVVPTREL